MELRHRQHARVEDRIRQAKATGLRNLPCRAFNENAAWLEVVLMATDLIAWTKLIAFAGDPVLARCEIAAFRYRVLHVAARITRGARQTRCESTRHGDGLRPSPLAGTEYAPLSANHRTLPRQPRRTPGTRSPDAMSRAPNTPNRRNQTETARRPPSASLLTAT
ncbi:hypothetical protein GCM10022231_19780 [Gordonia caeni]|uniref:Transposase DDE domain-containing protein n=1 Tax=Gordonia caeni TaxID=1007097 RepID=A0ABP7P5D5_9ACTN